MITFAKIIGNLIGTLVAIMWWTLTFTNTARFVMEVAEHHKITWTAYGYGALAGLAIVCAVNGTYQNVKGSEKKS